MRFILLQSAITGLAAAAPIANPFPQDIDIDRVKAAPIPAVQGPAVGAVNEAPTYNPAAAASAVYAAAATSPASTGQRRKRDFNDDCGVQPDGYGPTSTPDTADYFLSDPQYPDIASAAPVPQGYTQTFSNLQGSVEGNGYLGLYTMNSFDTVQCQEHCDAAPACYGINVFMERDPSLKPADACPDPTSITNYKCTLWGLPVNAASATNVGQWRDDFHVVIAGSNGYVKNAPPPPCDAFDGPTELGGAIQAPYSYIRMSFYAGPYDPSLCANDCLGTTTYDHDHPTPSGTYDACNFFNAYVLSEDDVALGTYCSLYTQSWDKSYSTNYGQFRGDDRYSVSSSYAYTLSVQDPGVVSP